jgi:rhamnopyranosyl-N-acetylglucosaminyl-diphospho-decaprenol beta-1,3/1,4-galactofuranosyltransferase
MTRIQTMPKIVASVVTFNRKQALLECLEALAEQTVPTDEVIVIDNGSTDGTELAIAGSGLSERIPVLYVRLERNVGAAGGYNVAFRESLKRSPEWIMLMSDDVVAAPDALEQLLSSEAAQDARTAALCPAIVGRDGHFQPEYTGGSYRFGQRFPLSASDHEVDAVQIEHASFMGVLIRGTAAEEVGPPMAEFFLSGDDLEWFLRLRGHWSTWLIPPARLVHQDHVPYSETGLRGALRRARRPVPAEEVWKYVYTFRNMSWIRRRYDNEGRLRFGLNVLKEWTRILLADPHRIRRMRLFLEYGRAGRRGDFRHSPPELVNERATARDSEPLDASPAFDANDLLAAAPPRRL